MSEKSSSARRDSGRLAARRRLRRRRSLIALGAILFVASIGILYELNQSPVRVSRIQIFGADDSFADIAKAQIQGSYFGLIPRDSTFFLPESDIRAAIIETHPDVAAVSIFRTGLSGISIKVNNRVPIARWCGVSPVPGTTASSTTNVVKATDLGCYLFDANGLIYATTSIEQPLNPFLVYETLALPTASSSPLGLILPNADRLPTSFDFARQLATLGAPVTEIVFRGDEVDEYLKSGTRITYVLGNEQNAFTALTSAGSNFNLADGSIDYVDLRFDGKVYLKKK